MRAFYAVIAISVTLTGCQSVDFGVSSITGQAPFKLRYMQTGEATYYIESLGNGFASKEMLEKYLVKKATGLCHGHVNRIQTHVGTAYPDGQLEGIKTKDCSTSWCNRDYALAPLVYGQAVCEPGSSG